MFYSKFYWNTSDLFQNQFSFHIALVSHNIHTRTPQILRLASRTCHNKNYEYVFLLEQLFSLFFSKWIFHSFIIHFHINYTPFSIHFLFQVIELYSKISSSFRQIIAYSVTDFDNPPNAIILQGAANAVGNPNLGGNSSTVIQLNPGTQYSAQFGFSFGSDKLAIRRKFGSNTWTDWKYFTAN